VNFKDIRRFFDRAFRWYAAGILCFFAFIPGWILFHALAAAVEDPHTVDLTWFLAVLVCSALIYFLLLVAYRACTGRGRKQDGGLLPPWALQILAVAFGAIGAAVSAFAIHSTDRRTVIGGLVEFLIAAAVFRIARMRRLNSIQPTAGETDRE
jgi:hypothetical protein